MSTERSEDSLEATLAGQQSDALPPPPRQIGPYELVERLGTGGMGEVWLADQLHPIRRRVALKIIKAGMDTSEVVARFMSERQALAMMEHPAIAKVLDAGSTPEGRPYFVMEYVDGQPIDRHCDEHRLSILERLALLAEVCDGVQHAHQKAIIHRDLKPSNILVALVDGRPQPKIIDFGIAKAIGSGLPSSTLLTELGGVVGTPEYMSPEQADLATHDVDTRSDVYSLGVVLYELLTGHLPFPPGELRSGGYEELRRRIRETEPTRPSTQVERLGAGAEAVARARGTDPGDLRRQLAGDLDAITLKALEKERERRYGAASELGEDLRRHLGHEPVVARPPSTSYRIRKYVRRHRLMVTLGTVGAGVLLAFTLALAVQVRRVSRERDRANREAATALRVSDFMARMFRAATPAEARGRQVTAREVLDRAARDVQARLEKDPGMQARLMSAIGDAYFSLGEAREAQPLLARTVETLERLEGPSSENTLRSRNTYAQLLRQDSRGAAESYVRETLARAERSLGPTHPITLRARRDLASILLDEGKLQEGEKAARELVTLERQAHGPEATALMVALSDLATSLSRQRRFREAAETRDEAIRIQTSLEGEDHPDTIALLGNQAADEYAQGHYAAAERLQIRVLDYDRRVLGPGHPGTLLQMSNLANTYAAERRFAEAEQLLTQVLDTARKAQGPSSVSAVIALYNLACVAGAQPGQAGRALGFLRQAAALGMPRAMVEGMETDPDLAPLRKEPEFPLVLHAARNSQQAGGGG